MAEVLLGVADGPRGFQKLLVIKKLRDELTWNPEFVDMFFQEAKLAARLNHRNLVQTYEVGEDGKDLFLAMEYLEGQSLSRLLRRVGRADMDLDLVVYALSEVLAGLHEAHETRDFGGTPLDLVHRDADPQNVLVCYDGTVKLLDFGIAKSAVGPAKTEVGVLKGKLAYMSPEQAQAGPVDRRSDIFTMGVVLWEALAGQRLFSPDTQDNYILSTLVTGTWCTAREAAPHAPLELIEACDKAMAFSRDDRHATAAELRDALRAYLDSRPTRKFQEELGVLVSECFAGERARMSQRIQERIAQVEVVGTQDFEVIEIIEESSSATPAPSAAAEATIIASKKLPVAMGTAAIVLSLLALFLVMSRDAPTAATPKAAIPPPVESPPKDIPSSVLRPTAPAHSYRPVHRDTAFPPSVLDEPSAAAPSVEVATAKKNKVAVRTKPRRRIRRRVSSPTPKVEVAAEPSPANASPPATKDAAREPAVPRTKPGQLLRARSASEARDIYEENPYR